MNRAPIDTINDIDVLIFIVGKWLFGVDVDQVAQVIKSSPSSGNLINFEGEDITVTPFLSAYRINGEEEYSMENVIVVRAKEGYLALAVDMIENFMTLSTKAHISPLPPLVEEKKELSYLWGVARNGDDLILLVNLDQL